MFIAKYLQLAQKKFGEEIDLNCPILFKETEVALQKDCGITLKPLKDPDAGRKILSI